METKEKEVKSKELKEISLEQYTINILKKVNNDYAKIVIYLIENNKIEDLPSIEQDLLDNPNLPIDAVIALSKRWIPDDKEALSQYLNNNIGITIKDIKNHPEIDWRYDILSKNPNITWDYIEKHPHNINDEDLKEFKKYFTLQGYSDTHKRYELRLLEKYSKIEPEIKNTIKLYNEGKIQDLKSKLFEIFSTFYSTGPVSFNKDIVNIRWNEYLKDHVDHLIKIRSWNYDLLSEFNPYMPTKLIILHENKELNPDITPASVREHKDIDWNYELLARNTNFTYEDLIEHLDKVSFIVNFSQNPNIRDLLPNLDDWINIDWESDKQKNKTWDNITSNSGISLQDIANNPKLPWNLNSICKNPNITYKTIINNDDKIVIYSDYLLTNKLNGKYKKDVKFPKFFMLTNLLYQYIIPFNREEQEVYAIAERLFNHINRTIEDIVKTNTIPDEIIFQNKKLKLYPFSISGIIRYQLENLIQANINQSVNRYVQIQFKIPNEINVLSYFVDIYRYLGGLLIIRHAESLDKKMCSNDTDLILQIDEIKAIELDKLISFEYEGKVYCLIKENLIDYWNQELDNHGESNAFTFGDCEFQRNIHGEFKTNAVGYRIALEDTCKKFYKIPLAITIRISEQDKNEIIRDTTINYWKLVKDRIVRMGREFHYYGENNEDEQIYKAIPKTTYTKY